MGRLLELGRLMDAVHAALKAEKFSGEIEIQYESATGTRWVGRPSKNDIRLEIKLTKIPHKRKPP